MAQQCYHLSFEEFQTHNKAEENITGDPRFTASFCGWALSQFMFPFSSSLEVSCTYHDLELLNVYSISSKNSDAFLKSPLHSHHAQGDELAFKCYVSLVSLYLVHFLTSSHCSSLTLTSLQRLGQLIFIAGVCVWGHFHIEWFNVNVPTSFLENWRVQSTPTRFVEWRPNIFSRKVCVGVRCVTSCHRAPSADYSSISFIC